MQRRRAVRSPGPFTHAIPKQHMIRMRNLLGWLETRLPQDTLNHIKLILITLTHKQLKLFEGNLSQPTP